MGASFLVPVAYDWRMLPASLAGYHDAADEILVGVDRNLLTWAGTMFDMPAGSLEQALAPFPRARIVYGDFHDWTRTPIENDSREREALARHARNQLVVEVDVDERVDGAAVVRAAEWLPQGHQLYGVWTHVFKIIGDTALVVDNRHGGELCALATRSRTRKLARQTGEPPVVANLSVLHNTLGRSEAEVAQKLAGWGHAHQVRPGFLELWRSIDLTNYGDARDLHPFIATRWPSLKAVPTSYLPWS